MAIIYSLDVKNRVGTTITDSYLVPSDASGTYSLLCLIPEDELYDLENGISLVIEVSEDNLTFKHLCSLVWKAEIIFDLEGNLLPGVGLRISAKRVANKYIKATFTTNKPMKIGFQLENNI